MAAGSGSTVPQETQREIVRLYDDGKGLSQRQLAARFYWSRRTIRSILAAHDAQFRPRGGYKGQKKPPRLTETQIDSIIELHQGGLSLARIAARVDIPRSTVRRYLRQRDIARSRSESIHLDYLRRIAEQGELALPWRQRDALTVLERGKALTTRQIARHVIKTFPDDRTERIVAIQRVRDALDALVRIGLVARDKRRQRGRIIWRRTQLHIRDVFQAELTKRGSDKPDGLYLPIGPFRAWLQDKIAREERKAKFMAITGDKRGRGDGSGGIQTVGALATRLSTDERVIWRWLNENKTISLASVDRALQSYGDDTRLEDLYPVLAEFDEAVA